jgi:predicted DNA repair protein MutK
MLEPKQQVKKKFAVGLILIISSLVLGKLVLVPLILFPGNETVRIAMIVTYAFSWLLMIPGVYLAGREGLKLVQKKYKEYGQKTVSRVKEQSKKTVTRVKQHSTKLKERSLKLKEQSKKAAQRTKKILKRKKKIPSEKSETAEQNKTEPESDQHLNN